jgi:nicotinate phosphoribosyltransferase
VEIFASGGLDEFEIDELLSAGATIDAFGVGTKLGVSGDAPWLDAAYKMVSYEDRPVLKLSTGKPSLPGPKQVYRRYDAEGRLAQDVIAARDEVVPEAEPLLEKVMEKGRPLRASPSLEELRRRFAGEFARLPEAYKALRGAPEYPVEVSAGLQRLYETAKVQAEAISLRELGES